MINLNLLATLKDIRLRILEEADVTQSYVNWFNDEEVIKFSDNQYKSFSLEEQKSYVREMKKNESVKLYGIFDSQQKHIGNVVLSGIGSIHNRAEITFVVGERDYWGKGVATNAVSKICNLAKTKFYLNKVSADCAHLNEGSKSVLLKNGFKLEGIRKKHLYYGGVWMDQLDFGLFLK